MAENEFVTDVNEKFNSLGLEYTMKIIDCIKKNHVDTKIKLFTNSKDLSGFPEEFEHLKENVIEVRDLGEDAVFLSESDISVKKLEEGEKFEIEGGNNGCKDEFDLIVISPILSYEK
jgi:hypothetical protein